MGSSRAGRRRPARRGLDDGGGRCPRDSCDRAADEAEAGGHDIRLRRLARAFELAPDDVELLLIALAPDLDPRFERLYGYLHDDVSRRRASAGLALELAGAGAGVAAAWSACGSGRIGPLVSGGIVLVEDADRPFLTRSLRVADRVTAHLLGDDPPDPAIAALLVEPSPARSATSSGVARAIGAGVRSSTSRSGPARPGAPSPRPRSRAPGAPVLELDLDAPGARRRSGDVAAAPSREAGLRGAGIVAGPVETLSERGPAAVRAFAESPGPVVLVGKRAWDPAWAREAPLLLEAPVPTIAERHELWLGSLNGAGPADFDPAVGTAGLPAHAGADRARGRGGAHGPRPPARGR